MKTEGRSAGLTADQFGTGQQGGNRQGTPEAEDVDAFARMMARPLGAKDEPRAEPAARLDGQGAGDAILRGLHGRPMAEAATPGREGPSRLIEQLAERVLVSEPEARGGREVRITIKDSHFAGLEVRIAERGGRLEVDLVCRSQADVVLLQGHVQGLLQRLGQRSQRQVEVRVLREEAPDGPAAEEPGIEPPRMPR